MLIDAIADNEVQAYLDAKSPAHLAAATWASASGVPILSIDSPFGVDHDTGLSNLISFSQHFVAQPDFGVPQVQQLLLHQFVPGILPLVGQFVLVLDLTLLK